MLQIKVFIVFYSKVNKKHLQRPLLMDYRIGHKTLLLHDRKHARAVPVIHQYQFDWIFEHSK